MRLLTILLILAGCTTSISALPVDGNGGPYKGTATGSGSGTFTLDIGNRHYVGQWANASSGGYGYFGAGGTNWGGFGSSYSTGPGIGLAHGKAADGSVIRCKFTFSDWSYSGNGMCKDSDGREYDIILSL